MVNKKQTIIISHYGNGRLASSLAIVLTTSTTSISKLLLSNSIRRIATSYIIITIIIRLFNATISYHMHNIVASHYERSSTQRAMIVMR